MAEAFDLNQDNLLLQLKNMPKPPISKELAKENQKEIDYVNNMEKQYIKEQKAEFNRILDEQNKEQQKKYQKLNLYY